MGKYDEILGRKIVLPDGLQKEILNFFLKTSIPRIARQKREQQEELAKEKNRVLSEEEGQNIK